MNGVDQDLHGFRVAALQGTSKITDEGTSEPAACACAKGAKGSSWPKKGIQLVSNSIKKMYNHYNHGITQFGDFFTGVADHVDVLGGISQGGYSISPARWMFGISQVDEKRAVEHAQIHVVRCGYWLGITGLRSVVGFGVRISSPTWVEAPVVLRKFRGDEALDGAWHLLGG